MKLEELKISGLKCYLNSGTIPIHNLTVFIGENDAGKSTIFDALEIMFNNKSPHIDDFREGVENIDVEVKFDCTDIDEEFGFLIHNDEVRIKKNITTNGISSFYYFTKVYEDNKLNSYESLNAVDLKALLVKYELNEEPNQSSRREAIKNYIETSDSISTIETWNSIRQNEISNFLPIFQRFSSNDYGNPESSIRKTLALVYRSSFYNKDEDGNETLKSNFSDLKTSITEDLNNKLENQLLSQLQKYKPEITSIKGSYDIDFARGLSFSGLNIVDQSGRDKTLSQIGEGSKKKIFLSILEWDAEINSENSSNKLIIRGYDEPDSNLHYEAQRKMFYVIRDLAEDQSTNVQSMICTHSITMIDRAPSKCINHIIRNPTQELSEIQFLQSESDSNIKDFLDQVSEVSGFKNSSLFYEKCFLIVEGESEQNALPIMYKKIYGRYLSEDGIVLINLQTNGQWNNALRFLNSNKNDCTVMLLDNDTQEAESLNQVTTAKLNEIGFNSTFLSSNCFFIGTKEFEDEFTNHQLLRTFNSKFIKHSGSQWNESEIAALRSDTKFSKALKIKLSQECRRSIGKPLLATELANELTKEEIQGIVKIKDLFDKIQTILE